MAVFDDWRVNRGRRQIQVYLALFRLAQTARKRFGRRSPFALLATSLHRTVGLCLLGIDIPTSTCIGPRLSIHHGFGLVVHSAAVIGRDVTLRQGVTIGSAVAGGGAPVLEDGVSVGVSALVIGDIRCGRESKIGAGAVVVRSVPSGAVAVGNPARLLTKDEGSHGT